MKKVVIFSLLKFFTLSLSVLLLSFCVFQYQAKAAVSMCPESPIGSEMYRSGNTIHIAWRAEDTTSCSLQIELYYQWSKTSINHAIGTVSYQNEGTCYWTAPYVSSTDYLQIIARMTRRAITLAEDRAFFFMKGVDDEK